MLALLVHPALHKHACKWLYRQEWEASLVESHPPSPARDEVLGQFREEVGVIERALRPALPHLRPGSLPASPPPVAWLL